MIKTMDELKQVNRRWFKPKQLKFFHTEIESPLKDGYFITSDKTKGMPKKRYTVRKVREDGSIKTAGLFLEHDTKDVAHGAMNKLIEKDKLMEMF